MTTITIDRLGHKGDGVAKGPIFAPLTLPGETVEGEVEGDRMPAPRIITPSPDRVSAPCPHFRNCGGCALMHATDAFVATWKAEVVETALAAHGLTAPIRTTQTSAPRTRRRATLSGRRTKKGALIGFHARKSDTIVPITDCHLLHPKLMDVLPSLGEITRLGASRSATLSFALTLTETGIDCAVEGGKDLDQTLRETLPQFQVVLIRLTWNGEAVFTVTPPRLQFDGITVAPPPGAFLQATEEGEAALRDAVVEAVDGATNLLDLFAGCGTFTLPLARNAPVHAVEGAHDLVVALTQGARHAQGLKRITTEVRDLFRRPFEPDELKRFDAVVIDPPRAGAEAQTKALVQARIPQIAMVSCNPVTFARDAALLTSAGYRLNWVQVVDQFRWSPHVELAASLSLPNQVGE